MRTDNEIERDVKDELQWDPDLDATDIAVSVKQGVVTLAGFVKSWSDKYEAEAAAKRVSGVKGIANDLEVRLPGVDERPDPVDERPGPQRPERPRQAAGPRVQRTPHRDHQRTEWRSITPQPRATATPPGSVPEKVPKGWT